MSQAVVQSPWKRQSTTPLKTGSVKKRRTNSWRTVQTYVTRDRAPPRSKSRVLAYFTPPELQLVSAAGSVTNTSWQANPAVIGALFNNGGYTAMFDQYCVRNYIIEYYVPTVEAFAPPINNYPRMVSCYDPDSAGTDKSYDLITQDPSHKFQILHPGVLYKQSFRPIFSTTTGSQGGSRAGEQWLDIANLGTNNTAMNTIQASIRHHSTTLPTGTPILYYRLHWVIEFRHRRNGK